MRGRGAPVVKSATPISHPRAHGGEKKGCGVSGGRAVVQYARKRAVGKKTNTHTHIHTRTGAMGKQLQYRKLSQSKIALLHCQRHSLTKRERKREHANPCVCECVWRSFTTTKLRRGSRKEKNKKRPCLRRASSPRLTSSRRPILSLQ